VAEYGERRLEEGGKPHIAILSTRTFGHTTAQCTAQPHIFSTYKPERPSPFPRTADSTPLWKAVRASSAAPGYFPTLQLAGASHLDGAVVANNPAQLALLETDLLWPARPLCCLFSVGTGRVLQHSRAGMGAGLGEAVSAAWAGLADTETTHHLLRHQLPGKEYWRLSPALQPENILRIDEVDEGKLEHMMQDARRSIERNDRMLGHLAERLKEHSTL